MASKHVSPSIEDMLVTSTMRKYFIPNRMATDVWNVDKTGCFAHCREEPQQASCSGKQLSSSLIIRPNSTTPGCSRKMKICLHRNLFTNIYSSTVCNNHKVQIIPMPINWTMAKKVWELSIQWQRNLTIKSNPELIHATTQLSLRNKVTWNMLLMTYDSTC